LEAKIFFDAVVALEEDLIGQLEGLAEVDGHDVGCGGVNVFIFTSDPRATFQRARSLLERRNCLRVVTAAYRAVNGERYTVIWPEDSTKEFRIA
jgi:hypothetical protein